MKNIKSMSFLPITTKELQQMGDRKEFIDEVEDEILKPSIKSVILIKMLVCHESIVKQ